MKLHKNTLGVIIWSGDYKKLAKWYEEVLGFPVNVRQNLPGDTYVGFDLGDDYFSIGQHSKVGGSSKDPYRIMVGFNVDSVQEVYDDLKNKDVEIVAKPFESPEGGYYALTIKDPEGNIIQFFSTER